MFPFYFIFYKKDLIFDLPTLYTHSSFLSLSLDVQVSPFFLFVLFYFLFAYFLWNCIGANWCVCKEGLGDAVWQKTLDYACGAGADCNPIHSNGGCFNPNTVKAHCNYAVNSYFQKKGQAQGSCDFAGTANPVTSDPSKPDCNSFCPSNFLGRFR